MIENIVIEAGMVSSAPSHYTGNGATLKDLNSIILNKIANAVKQEYGSRAYESFVDTVWRMKALSAYALLENLYSLFQLDWDTKNLYISNKDYSGNEDGEYFIGYDEETVRRIENPNKENQTEKIRDNFVRLNK